MVMSAYASATPSKQIYIHTLQLQSLNPSKKIMIYIYIYKFLFNKKNHILET